MYAFTWDQVLELIAQEKTDELWRGIIDTYHRLEEKHDFILCEGTDFNASSTVFEFDINAAIADVLGSPVLLVANSHQKTIDKTLQSIEMAHTSLADKGCRVIATIINLTTPEQRNEIFKRLKETWSCRAGYLYPPL